MVTTADTLALSPEFQTDGRILYTRRRADGAWELVAVNVDGSNGQVVSDKATGSYWEPTGAGTMVIAHGPGARSKSDGKAPSLALFPPDGTFQISGSPFRKQLPDREIDVIIMRSFTAALNPAHDLVALTAPPAGTDLLLARPDGGHRFRLFMLSAAQSTFAGISVVERRRVARFYAGRPSRGGPCRGYLENTPQWYRAPEPHADVSGE